MNNFSIASFDATGEDTTYVDDCGNNGCGFCQSGKCSASGTECFGYIDPDWKDSQEHFGDVFVK